MRTFPAWRKIKTQILDAKELCKMRIKNANVDARCIFRVYEMKMIIRRYERTLDPHGFCLPMEHVFQIPDIHEVIIYGTDEEFSTCVEEVGSGLPNASAQFLEERTARISALVPFNERPDNVLSLATVWFSCGLCHQHLIHGDDMPSHLHPTPHVWSSGEIVGGATFISLIQKSWAENFKPIFSETASTIARELILDCGEDPESITLDEICSKFHRFIIYENDEPVAYNWGGTVSSTGFVGAHCPGLNPPPVRVQNSQPLRIPSVPRARRMPGVCARS